MQHAKQQQQQRQHKSAKNERVEIKYFVSIDLILFSLCWAKIKVSKEKIKEITTMRILLWTRIYTLGRLFS